MNKPKYIKGWNELKEEKSPTHIIEMDESGYCGWITPKVDDGSWKTNTTYQRILFMVVLMNILQKYCKNVALM